MKLINSLAIAALSLACASAAVAQKPSRGIGVYPGNPDECFAPTVSADRSGADRDVAFRRRALASSQADYDKTATWLTNGGDRDNYWRSLHGGEQWVMVDFGAPAALDMLVTGWIDRPERARVALSNDGVRWREGFADALADTVRFGGRPEARFVRIDMWGKPDKTYAISSLKAIGRGGVTVTPHVRDSRSLDGGDWRLKPVREIPEATGEELSTGEIDTAPWMIATVPGTVLTSYIDNGAVPDPNHMQDELQISENFFDTDFWYYTTFETPRGRSDAQRSLEFDGVNWKGDVWLNGTHLGRIDGAFRRGSFDVTKLLNKRGPNHLAVKIHKPATPGETHTKTTASTGKNGGKLGADNPTFHASVGWDWITTVRGRNIGIWNDVRLTERGPVALADPMVTTVLALPDTTATLTASVVVTNNSRRRADVDLCLTIGDDIKVCRKVTLAAGADSVVTFSPAEFPQLAERRMALWWPAGYGAQVLYPSSFTATVKGRESDRTDFNTGIRQMTYTEANGILNMYVNGRRFVGRGGNWGFPEHNLAYRGREYDAAVGNHARMNCTLIRNWVGQTGDEEFYDACDRHGVMIWQDFWLANPGDGPNPDNEEMFVDNARDYVKRIRRHPSIALYCGRNEGNPPASLDSALRATVAELHPDMHYISHSAAGVVSGFGPYSALRPAEYFHLQGGIDRLHSERGMPNVMTPEGTRRALGEDAAWPLDLAWAHRDFTYGGAQNGNSFMKLNAKALGESESAEQFARRAQLTNYEGYRAMYEARSPHRQGLLIWMSHPAEPSMVWQTYDYYLEPTAGFFGVKKACEPLHIQWNQRTDSVEVVNISAGDRRDLTAKLSLYDIDGKLLATRSAAVSPAEDTTTPLMRRPGDFDEQTPVEFVCLSLTDADGRELSHNVYLRGREEGNYRALLDRKPAAPVLRSWTVGNVAADGSVTGTAVIANTSQQPVVMARLNLVADDGDQILPVTYSDNYITLMPGEQTSVTVGWNTADARSDASPRIILSTVLD